MEENKTNEQVELTPVSELAPVLNVLKEHDAQAKATRLKIAYFTANVIKSSVELLGMRVVERM